MSLIALAVIDGQLAWTRATRAALSHADAARPCARACPYGHDIATAIDTFVVQRGEGHEPGLPGG